MPYAQTMPDPIAPDFTQNVELDGVEYAFHYKWNPRAGWYLGLKDAATGNTILSPQRLRANWDLLRYCTVDRRPPGILMAVDMSGQYKAPGYTDLDARVKIVYTPEAEL